MSKKIKSLLLLTCFITSITNLFATNVDPNLKAIAVYDMEDSLTDGMLKDKSGNGNDGEVMGSAPKTADGKFGKALVFDGEETYINLVPLVVDADEWTFAAWVKPDKWDNWARIFDFGDGMATDLWCGYSGDDRQLRIDIFADGVFTKLLAGNFVRKNKWTHFAVTIDGSQMVVYLNGRKAVSTATQLIPSQLIPNGLFIGRSNWADPLFTGMMDDIIIAKKALSAKEIKQIKDGLN